MNKEELFEVLGMVDDKLIERSEEAGTTVKNSFVKWTVAAACFLFIASAGFWLLGKTVAVSDPETNDNGLIADEAEQGEEEYIDVSMLLASDVNGINDEALEITHVNIDDYSANYYKVQSADSITLKKVQVWQLKRKKIGF